VTKISLIRILRCKRKYGGRRNPVQNQHRVQSNFIADQQKNKFQTIWKSNIAIENIRTSDIVGYWVSCLFIWWRAL